MSLGGILLGLLFLMGGIFTFHYGIDMHEAMQREEQGLAIGTAIFLFILGNLIINIEMRKENK